jgi:hypothetical protein
MSANHHRRLDDIAKRIQPTCKTCYGFAFAIVFVPQGEDEHAADWRPTHCRECGIQLRHVRQIVGISEAEMFGDDVQPASP